MQYFQAVQQGKKRANEAQMKLFDIAGFAVGIVDENKILNSNINRHIEAKELIVVDHPWYHKGFILNEVEFLPAWIIHWLRDIYLKSAKQFENNEKIEKMSKT